MRELLRGVWSLFGRLVSRRDELMGQEDIAETADEPIHQLEEAYDASEESLL